MKGKTPETSRRLHAVESEKAVLGTLLYTVDEDAWRVAEEIPDVFFVLERHRIIFGRMMAHLLRARQDGGWPPCDASTLVAEFQSEGRIDEVGGVGYLLSLTDAGKSEYTLMRQHATAVIQAAERRGAVQACQRVIDDLTEPSEDEHGEAMARAGALLKAATEVGGKSEIVWLDALIHPAYVAISEPSPQGAEFRTGLASVDKRINPRRGKLTVLGAGTSMGKTAALVQLAHGLAAHGHRVVFDIREMDAPEMVDRLLTLESGAPVRDLKDEVLSHAMPLGVWEQRIRAVCTAAENLWGLPIGFASMAGCNVEKIAAMARRAQQREGLDVLIVDYLQLIPASRGLSGEERWAHITTTLKQLAMELGIWVILASQLNRKPGDRINKRPQMGDLKGSGAIEADADHICLLYRPVYYKAKEEGKEESSYPDELRRGSEWGWVKVRGGSTGTDHMLWFGEKQRYVCAELSDRRDDECWQ